MCAGFSSIEFSFSPSSKAKRLHLVFFDSYQSLVLPNTYTKIETILRKEGGGEGVWTDLIGYCRGIKYFQVVIDGFPAKLLVCLFVLPASLGDELSRAIRTTCVTKGILDDDMVLRKQHNKSKSVRKSGA